MTSEPPALSDLALRNLEGSSVFAGRHIGPTESDVHDMLRALGHESLTKFCQTVVPEHIRARNPLALDDGCTEHQTLVELREMAATNRPYRTFIGMGYHGTVMPPVLQRNILENPGWYTAYTPYQAEIAQGRLEALLNFQTMICDLTGMDLANASLLDEGTAAAEAMAMALHHTRGKTRPEIWVANTCHPQTLAVLEARAEPLQVSVRVGDPAAWTFDPQSAPAACLVQYPDTFGAITDHAALFDRAHTAGTLCIAAADLLALVLLKPPGAWGADVVVGSAQRFGVPMGFGGPHAAYFAIRDAFKRSMPGRMVGVSRDAAGRQAYRLALQTREQHIRRERATSNICTSQVLLAVLASMYAVYHGPKGLGRIAERVHRYARILRRGLDKLGITARHEEFFDTLAVSVDDADAVLARARAQRMNLRPIDARTVGINVDETTQRNDLEALWAAVAGSKADFDIDALDAETASAIPEALRRDDDILTHPVFNRYHAETEMVRYLENLRRKDVSLTQSMIPLGSCTMKLNAAVEMLPIGWHGFANMHPFAPAEQTAGYKSLTDRLSAMLAEITGFAAVSLQPNAGSQGELAGLLVIRKYHASRGEGARHVCLVPSSAHGTNPASAVMAGMEVVVVGCDKHGNIDVDDLRTKATAHRDALAALMITYPSTHGVFETAIKDICDIVHEHGGQVYLDGANLNALVGLCRPADFGADVAHLNLHKTFAIPHGGGGPGVGPTGAAAHLAPFLPRHPLDSHAGPETGILPVSSAPFGSAGVLPISFAYIRLMGASGLKRASEVAILSANYIAQRLSEHYDVLYKAKNGTVAHECILDLRPFKSSGVDVDDVAKRLMDFGFHAPTMSWPVAGTLMVEPTESESKAELDRFCDAMIAIRGEIEDIAQGRSDPQNNPLKRAPHTAADVASDAWDRPYPREQAAFPLPWVMAAKYWPPVSRIDNPYGDRNLMCTCPAVESYGSGERHPAS